MNKGDKKKYAYGEAWKHNKWTKLHKYVGHFLVFMACVGLITTWLEFIWPANSFEFFFGIYYLWLAGSLIIFFTLHKPTVSLFVAKVLGLLMFALLTFFILVRLGFVE